MKHLIKFFPYIIIGIVILIICIFFMTSSFVSNEISNNTPLIIIDAGHGGKDGGAVASDGSEEQYINLDIALKLNELLTESGYKTLLTRTDNNSIHDESAKTIREQKVSDIHNRLKIIENNPNSVFVSIHQNFYTQKRYWGAQVFYSENNLSSSYLAKNIQESIKNNVQPDNNREIKPAGDSIFILYNTTVPAVLVECGFLSNDEEAEKLSDESYRMKIAEAISDGVIKYISYQNETESLSEVN